MNTGYDFYFKMPNAKLGYEKFQTSKYAYTLLTFPITPGELSIKVGSKNEVITLIDEGDVNILKSPSLTEVEFEARFPMRQYPYSRPNWNFPWFFKRFTELKENRWSFQFIVARTKPNGKRSWETNMTVSLEDFTLKESANEGDDVLIKFKLKQYKPYGIKKLTVNENGTATKKEPPRDNGGKGSTPEIHTVKEGDTLYTIAKVYYGDGGLWKNIYNANKNVIEYSAKENGKESSSYGHSVYLGMLVAGSKLIIPGVDSKLKVILDDIPTSASPTIKKGLNTYAITVNCGFTQKYAGTIKIEYVNSEGKIKIESYQNTFSVRALEGTGVKLTIKDANGHHHLVSIGDGSWRTIKPLSEYDCTANGKHSLTVRWMV
jgi:LysM repeat protein